MPDVEKIEQAKSIIGAADHFGASLLQRKMKIGYATAARLIDDMVEMGYARKKPGGPGGIYELIYENDEGGELTGTPTDTAIQDDGDDGYAPDEFIPDEAPVDEDEIPH